MTDSEFKLPSSSFSEIGKIIQAYAQINKPASLDDISKRTGINTTTVSGNNGFLISIGVVEGGKSKSATAIGKKLGDALGHSLEEESRFILRQIVEDTEFLKNVLGAIRIRRGMEEGSLRSHIAYSAGAGKSPSVTTGAGAVLELLVRSGAVQEEDGKYVVGLPVDAPLPTETSTPSVSANVLRVTEAIQPLVVEPRAGISLSIEVKISCGPDDLDGLGDKLRKILADFNRQVSEE